MTIIVVGTAGCGKSTRRVKMCNRLVAGALTLLALIWPVISVAAQGEPSGTPLPRTADGLPDLGGV